MVYSTTMEEIIHWHWHYSNSQKLVAFGTHVTFAYVDYDNLHSIDSCSSRQTAAGFPENGSCEKASTVKYCIFTILNL